MFRASLLGLLVACAAGVRAEEPLATAPIEAKVFAALPGVDAPPLDTAKIAAEDAQNDYKGRVGGLRFAIPLDVDLSPANAGEWARLDDGSWQWRLRVTAKDAAHLNFGFKTFLLPPSAELRIQRPDGKQLLGPYTDADHLPTGQLWTPVLAGNEALIELRVADHERADVALQLVRIAQGYRGFGARPKWAKSGACNMDVACLGSTDAWNDPRGSVGAITRGGTDTCTGSLVNNTNNDRRMLFATATHCGLTAANIATVLVYWRYENPTCRTPGSAASGTPIPKPSTTSAGIAWLAATNNPFGGGGAGNTRSDWTLVELGPPNATGLDLKWAGWDRRGAATPVVNCAAPPLQPDPSLTDGLCAAIHHPSVDEKRITFVDRNYQVGDISSATSVHWHSWWAGATPGRSPPVLPNIPAPPPSPVPNGVTEPGSSGSPLYSADRRLIGVLSGGPSACGSTGDNLSDFYGALFHSYEGAGIGACNTSPPLSTTCMRPYLDPVGTNPEFIDGIGECTPPSAPAGLTATPNGDNRIDLTWSAAPGAERYSVYRAIGTCPATNYALIAADVTLTSYSDTAVSGGTTYSYRVTSTDDGQPCTSGFSSCDDALATGLCTLAPIFGGLTSAQSAGSVDCGVNLTWSAATANCGVPAPTYSVYRGLTPGFVPAPANRIASCVATAAYADDDVDFGTTYHYVVRAEDGTSNGGGACNSGNEDDNTVRRSTSPAGPDTIAYSDDVEAGTGVWTVAGSGAGSNFAIVTTASNSPTHSWFVPDPTAVTDRQLAMSSGVSIPVGGAATLEFFHRYVTEASWDGGVVEYSLDGAAWFDILAGNGGVIPANPARFLEGGYTGALNSSGNPLSTRPAWHGTNGAAFTRVRVNLADFANQNVRFRFRFGADASVGATGWWVDDVRVFAPTACQNGPADLMFQNGFENP